MTNFRRIAIIFTILTIIVIGGHVVPALLKTKTTLPLTEYPFKTPPQKAIAQSDKSILYLDSLKRSVFLVKEKKNKKGITWVLGRGIDLPVQLLGFQNALKRLDCIIKTSLENSRKDLVTTKFTCPDLKSYELKFSLGNSFIPNSSQLSILLFASENIDSTTTKELSKLNIPFSLIFNPHKVDSNLTDWLRDSGKHASVVLEIIMEPEQYIKRLLPNYALLISNSESEIADKIDDLFELYPTAIAVTNQQGTRAIAHKKTLTKVIEVVKGHRARFIDMTNFKLSKSERVCKEVKADCLKIKQRHPKNIKHFLESTLYNTHKLGKHTIAIPLKSSNIKALNQIIDRYMQNGIKFVKLTDF